MTALRNGTHEQREAPYQHLTQTSRGTPSGELLRRYWQPVGLSGDVTPNGAPRAIRILGENLVLYRDDRGRPGLLARKCAHRCADLSYGRVEDGGLRCIYHGWLYDVDGKCLEQPGEPKTSTFKEKVHQPSYPCHEAGGAIWAYFGPGEPPLFPNYPAVIASEDIRYTARWLANCNWLQGNEGNIDPIHTSYLHRFELTDAVEKARMGVFHIDHAPELSIEDTRFGLRVYTQRQMPDSDDFILRITNQVMPNACAINGAEANAGPGGCSMFWHVPIDDEHHWRFEFTFHVKGVPKETMTAQYASEKDAADRPQRNPDNRYLQDRDSMEHSYLGMGKCFPAHDLFVTESQGAIHEQADEHLASSDVAIARARRLLAEAIRTMEAGGDPRGVVRDPVENVFDDIVVITKQLPAGTDKRAYCNKLASERMYG
jgi:phenylpropionate dioxygenase-like ring-hydroxylating dioxygenase large terminal subunit